MTKKVYCPKCQHQVGLIRIVDYGNCQPPTYLEKLSNDGKIILRKGASGSDALYAKSCCKIGLPKYGTFDEWRLVVRSNDKKKMDEFFEKEKKLVGESYVKEILQSTGRV